tara:strand:- start:475 stop:1653 length:1179 start_codon:yes stop_codon:yes gene_type:complete
MAIYYLDGTTLLNSQAVFTDQALTACAPDGFYSDGTLSRQLVNCLLQPPEVCGDCGVPCGTNLSESGNQGVYQVDLEVGTTTGAVIVTFNPAGIPDGFRAVYNGQTYNELSSPVDGYHASTVATNYTFIGDTKDDCGIAGTTYPNLVVKTFVVGQGFQNTGTTQSLSVGAGDVSLSSSPPGICKAVIPKPNASPSLMDFSFVGPCSGTAFSLDIACPVKLSSFQTNTQPSNNREAACDLSNNGVLFSVPVTGTTGNPALHDWIFIDNNGVGKAANGFYRKGAGTIRVAQGVVVELTDCIQRSFFISLNKQDCTDFCDGTNYTIPLEKTTTSNHDYLGVTIGDVIPPPVIQDGFYAYAATSTDTATGPYRQMQLQNNQVLSLSQCAGGICAIL